MAIAFQSAGDRLSISGELTVFDIREARDRLLPWVEATPAPELELSGVTELDCAGLQLLRVAARRAVVAGKSLNIHEPSAAVRDVLVLCQVGDLTASAGEVA